MLVSLAWRNLARNRRRSILTGSAVAIGLMLIVWMRGLQDGSYDQMIDQAVKTRLGHLQVMHDDYLVQNEPHLTVENADALIPSLSAIDHVKAISPRAISEGMLARDSEMSPVDLLGVNPEAEKAASTVPERLLRGEKGVTWCHKNLGRAVEVMGGDQRLFDRWCATAGTSRYLPADNERAIVVGAGLAKRLLVSVGDEVTVQVVRAKGTTQAGESSLSQRRLEVTGIIRTANPEIDDRVAYVNIDTLTGMLGTEAPNELVIVLDDIDELEHVRSAASGIVGQGNSNVFTWYERNPSLQNLIQVDSRSGSMMYVILIFLVALGVVNATLMSVLERTREFGVMLSLGMKRIELFKIIMLEVALLGAVAVGIGSLLGVGVEAFGRIHGYPMEWFGADLSNTSMAGVVYDPIYYAALDPSHAVMALVGVYSMFLLAGFLPAIHAARLHPIEAMRQK